MTTEAESNAKDHFIRVAVLTTSGSFPSEEFERVPINQPVDVVLKRAAKHLKLTDTDGWVARVDETEIDPTKNYRDNGLAGEITIDWGPAEGGGGA